MPSNADRTERSAERARKTPERRRSGVRRSHSGGSHDSYGAAAGERDRLIPSRGSRDGRKPRAPPSVSPTVGGYSVQGPVDDHEFLDYGARGRPNRPGSPGNSADGPTALKVDLQKVAYRLCIPLRSLLDHFQNDPSSEPHINIRDGAVLQLKVPDEDGEFLNPTGGSPSPYASPNDSCEAMPSPTAPVVDDDEVESPATKRGTTVLVAHHASEGSTDGVTPNAHRRQMRSQDFFSAASLQSDDPSCKIDIQANDGDLPHIAYLMQDASRGMSMIVIPGLRPVDPQDLPLQRRPSRVKACFSRIFDFPLVPEHKHESTSYLGEVSCMDLVMMCLKKENVVKSVVLYADGPSLYLQVQRRMPYWSVPCLVAAMTTTAFLPALYQKVYRSYPQVDERLMSWYATSHVWAAVAELMVVVVLLLACLVRYRGEALYPMKNLFVAPVNSRGNLLLLGFVAADVVRVVCNQFVESPHTSRGPSAALSTCHTLLLLCMLLATSRTVPIIGTLIAAAFAIVGAIVATITLPSWGDWAPTHGVVASAAWGVAVAAYLAVGHRVTANQPTVGLLFLCKALSAVVLVVFVSARDGGSKFFSEPFMGGEDSVGWVFVYAGVSVLAQAFVLKALKALHAFPVSTALLVALVLQIVFLHWCLDDVVGEFGSLDRKHILPGVCLTIVGLCVACGIAVSEGRYAEVDLTCPELTRKTARPPQKLTVASLRHHIRQTKSEPPMVWNYAPPPQVLDASFDTAPPTNRNRSAGGPSTGR